MGRGQGQHMSKPNVKWNFRTHKETKFGCAKLFTLYGIRQVRLEECRIAPGCEAPYPVLQPWTPLRSGEGEVYTKKRAELLERPAFKNPMYFPEIFEKKNDLWHNHDTMKQQPFVDAHDGNQKLHKILKSKIKRRHQLLPFVEMHLSPPMAPAESKAFKNSGESLCESAFLVRLSWLSTIPKISEKQVVTRDLRNWDSCLQGMGLSCWLWCSYFCWRYSEEACHSCVGLGYPSVCKFCWDKSFLAQKLCWDKHRWTKERSKCKHECTKQIDLEIVR